MKKNRMPLIITLVVFAALLGGGWWTLVQRATPNTAEPLASPQMTEVVTRRDLGEFVTLNGKLDPVERADLGFAAASRLADVLVQPGDRVQRDQPLATLQTSELEQQVESARAAVTQAEGALATLQAGPTAQEQAQAEQALVQARAGIVQAQQSIAANRLQTAQTQLDRATQLEQARQQFAQVQVQAEQRRAQASLAKTNAEQALVQQADALRQAQAAFSDARWKLDYAERTGFDPSTEGQPRENLPKLNSFQLQQFRDTAVQAEIGLRNAERALAQAQVTLEQARRDEVLQVQQIDADVRAAEQTLRKQESDPTAAERDAVARGQQAIDGGNVAAAQAALEAAQAGREQLLAGASEADRAGAETALARARTELAQAEAQLASATLRAPFDGIVIAVSRRAGEVVAENASVVTVVRDDQLALVGDVDEIAMLQLEVGQTVQLAVDALPTAVMTGTVTNVAAAPIAATGSQASPDAASRYPVRVLIEQPDPQARLGLAASAQVVTAQATGVLVVSPAALIEGAEGMFVERATGPADANGVRLTERVPVTVGLRTMDGVEIRSGVNEGDEVVVPVLMPAATPTGGMP